MCRYAAKRDVGSSAITVVMKDAQNVLGQGPGLRNYDLDAQGYSYDMSTGRDSAQVNSYDPTLRDWYKNTVTRNAPGWGQPEGGSGMYADAESGILIISAAVPVYSNDGSGTLLGVTLADLRMDDVSTFLRSLTIGKTGELFVVEDLSPWHLTGASAGPVVIMDNSASALSECACSHGIPSFVKVTESESSTIKDAWENLEEVLGPGAVGNYSDTGGFHTVTNAIKRVSAFSPMLRSTVFSDQYGLQWLVK